MKRLKYILIAALVVGLIVVGVWWVNQPALPYDKAAAEEADYYELVSHPEENWGEKVYVEGEVVWVFVNSDGDCSFILRAGTGRGSYIVETSGSYRRWVQPKCCKLSEGDRVKVWGYFWSVDGLPEIDACIIERR